MRIADIQDHGSIVLIYLEGDGAPDKPITFDHRSFRELTDARGGDLRGECHVEYSEDGPPLLVFNKDAPQNLEATMQTKTCPATNRRLVDVVKDGRYEGTVV